MMFINHFGAAIIICLLHAFPVLAQTEPVASDNKAIIHIYRASDDIMGRFNVEVNNQKVGKLRDLSVHTMEVTPGMLDIKVSTFGFTPGRLSILVETGGIYYIRIHDRSEVARILPKLEVLEVAERTFRRETGAFTEQ